MIAIGLTIGTVGAIIGIAIHLTNLYDKYDEFDGDES